jgi:hydroxyacylglutathione hydrolase
MKINQLYTHNELRNFTYIVALSDQTAIVIDPWDSDEVESFLDSNQLNLKVIINTHEHWDHTQGNQALFDRYQCEVWAHSNGKGKIPALSRTLDEGECIDVGDGYQLKVLDTPGHTFAHLCFVVLRQSKEIAVFTGDTLFNAGVGHCRGGDEQTLYKTISEQFQTMDDSIVVYPGHDYLENNLRFTLNFEPNNSTAKAWLTKVTSTNYQPGSLQTTIGNEKSFNTFMRLSNPSIIASLQLNQPSEKDVFLALRGKRDNW